MGVVSTISGNNVEITVEGEVGWSFTSQEVGRAIDSVSGGVTLKINSGGGDAVAGLAIYNRLRAAAAKGRPVATHNIAMAASAASIIMMAGDRRIADSTALFMLHQAATGRHGNAQDLDKAQRALEAFDTVMADIYAARTGQKLKDIEKMLEAETWLVADDGLAQGFYTEVLEVSVPVAAHAAHLIPERLRNVGARVTGAAMDIRKQLGLPATATDAEVEAAIARGLAAQAAVTAPAAVPAAAPAPAAAPDLETQIAAAIGKYFSAQEAARAVTAPAQQAAAASTADAHTIAASTLVDRQIAAGRITPAQREQAIRACGTSAAQLQACAQLWDAMPAVVQRQELGGVRAVLPGAADDGSFGLTPAQQQLCDSGNIKYEDFAKQLKATRASDAKRLEGMNR